MWKLTRSVLPIIGLLLAAGCRTDDGEGRRAGEAQRERERQELRFVVSRGERMLTVFRRDEAIRTHPVAIGQPEHPTPTGDWQIFRVDINPDWVPPDSEWAADREPTPPGHPANPMGRARLIFNPPYSIHGTAELDSLGTAASHGSIRVANDTALELAQLLLQAGGSWQGQAWFQRMVANPSQMHQITLDNPVPISVVN
jgi:murein L,D-transpeptidase YcbB/YkuD